MVLLKAPKKKKKKKSKKRNKLEISGDVIVT
jgi:hypothetical protein